MKTLHIGGVVSCQEPGCFKVFGTLADWEDHWYDEHQPEDSIRESSDVCYAHGLIARGC